MPDITFRKTLILLTILIALGIFAVIEFQNTPRTKVYNCEMAEWHPDIPKQVKDECRKLRYKTYQTTSI